MFKPSTHIAPSSRVRAGSQVAADVGSVLVFSPDADVANSLALLLESSFPVVTETDVNKLEDRLNTLNPAATLVDLFPSPSDIFRTIEILKRRNQRNPVVIFHVYRNNLPEVEKAVRSVSDVILYKPISADLVTELVSVLLAVHRNQHH